MIVCRIHRNDAEERINAMYKNDWNGRHKQANYLPKIKSKEDDSSDDVGQSVNYEELIPENISKYIQSEFKGYKMERLKDQIPEVIL